jgi:hypothetical protein
VINQTVFGWIVGPLTQSTPVLGVVSPAWLILAASIYFTSLAIFRRLPQRNYLVMTVAPPFLCFASWLALQYGVAYAAVIVGMALLGLVVGFYTLRDRFFRQYPRGIERARANVRFSNGILVTFVAVATGFTAMLLMSPTESFLLTAVNSAWLLAAVAALALLGDGVILLWQQHRLRRPAA